MLRVIRVHTTCSVSLTVHGNATLCVITVRHQVILPGYCVAGTVGAKVLAGHKSIEVRIGCSVVL